MGNEYHIRLGKGGSSGVHWISEGRGSGSNFPFTFMEL